MVESSHNSLKTDSTQPLLRRPKRTLVNFCPTIKRLGVFSYDGEGQQLEPEAVSLESRLFAFGLTHTTRDNLRYDWTIKRTFSDFQDLQLSLTQECRLYHIDCSETLPVVAAFQRLDMNEQLLQLERYLRTIGDEKCRCQLEAFLEFAEVSALSFDGKSTKRKEGYVFKRTGGRVVNEDYLCNCTKYFRRFQKRWLLIRDDMVGYVTRLQDENLHEALGFKGKFDIKVGKEQTGFADGIKLTTNTRDFLIRTGSAAAASEWFTEITRAYNESQWAAVGGNRYNSSFPVREGNFAKWYVDGKDYFREVCEELEKAKDCVYITDWWLSPELQLKRPSLEHPNCSVLEVLGTLADRGVKVYIHVYKEVSLALTINSLHTKHTFSQRSKRIRLVRHPHRSVVGRQFLWSHHEKAVVIDHMTAFLGGLDLCFGRWDTNEHLLFDPSPNGDIWPGIDYSNCRIQDFTNVEDFSREYIDRDSVPRMPWHDVALQVKGRIANDIALHFTELWNHVMTDMAGNEYKQKELLQPVSPKAHLQTQMTRLLIVPEEEDKQEQRHRPDSFALRTRVTRSHTQTGTGLQRQLTSGISESSRINIEKLIKTDHLMVLAEAVPLAEAPAVQRELANSQAGQRTPPLRTATALLGEQEEDSYTLSVRQLLCPHPEAMPSLRREQSHEDIERLETEEEKKEQREILSDSAQGGEQFARNLLAPGKSQDHNLGSCECQLVVSSSLWSYGYEIFENTIYSAYLHLINLANHFIYIENQFFISSTSGQVVKNQLAQALVDRIKVAVSNHEQFKVIVVMPLLPAFEGSVADPAAAVLRVQLYWEYETICRGTESIYAQLSAIPGIEDPKQYISFYGLRTHGYSKTGLPASEIVYVHSKLMIVDDKYVLLGSANINDRSLLGDRDSEIALVVEDYRKVASRMAGRAVEVSEFAYSLRMSLFREHSQGPEEVLRDPFTEEFDKFWRVRAQVGSI